MSLKHLIVSFLLLTSVACSNSGTGGGGKSPVNGTSDTGGGNGIENKAYEAYIVQTDQLPAYKALIEPKIKSILAMSPKGDQALPILKKWLLYKTWYIAPVALNTISKDVIGISFSKDQTEQLALQTKKSIWINSHRFNQMTLQDQATLIIHEMVMSLYYLKYKSWEDICTEKIYPDFKCDPTQLDLMNELFPGTDPTPFNSDDYENIRTVTGVFLGSFPFRSYEELDQFLIAHKFDRRFTFGLGIKDDGRRQTAIFNNNEQISVQTMNEVLETAKILNQLPDQCLGVRFKNAAPCQFQFNKSKRSNGNGVEVSVIELKTQSSDPSSPFEFTNVRDTLSKFNGSSIEFVEQKKKVYYWTFNPDPYPTPFIVGTLFRSLVLITTQDLTVKDPPHTFLGIQSIPGVVTGKNPNDPNQCSYAKPSAKSKVDDVIIVQSKYLSDFDKALLMTRASTMPPFTTCRPF